MIELNSSNTRNRIIEIFWKLILFSILIFPSGISEDYIVFYKVPYIRISQANVILIIITLSVIAIIIATKGRFYLDIISLCLLWRIIIGFIPLIYMPYDSTYWGNYFPVVVSFITFIVFTMYDGNINILLKWYLLFVICICIQVFITILSIPVSYSDILYKYYLKIPLGGTNRIACYLVPAIAIIHKLDYRRGTKYLLYICVFVGIIALKSRGSILLLGFYFMMNILIKIFKNKKLNRAAIFVISFMVPIGLVIFIKLFSINEVSGAIRSLLEGYNQYFLEDSFGNQITSGRTSLIIKGFKTFADHMFFGNGYAYGIGMEKTHLFIVDLLLNSGILGFVSFFIPIMIFTNKSNRSKSNDVKLIRNVVYLILAQSLFEINLFTISTDFIFWALIGCAWAIIRSDKSTNITINSIS